MWYSEGRLLGPDDLSHEQLLEMDGAYIIGVFIRIYSALPCATAVSARWMALAYQPRCQFIGERLRAEGQAVRRAWLMAGVFMLLFFCVGVFVGTSPVMATSMGVANDVGGGASEEHQSCFPLTMYLLDLVGT